jgi:ubiquinone/menaquinone biosynthesis C-methylase UbiE
MTELPGWFYDEMQQVGVDFEAAAAVGSYDRDQGADPAAERTLIARLGLGPGQAVVDLGCGTGSFALEAARQGLIVQAVDVSRAMLDRVAAKAEGQGLAGLSVHHAGFLTYRHAGAPPDAVVTRYALHHLPDFWKMAALTHLAALLAPGGKLYLEDVAFSFAPADYRAGIEAWIARVARGRQGPSGQGFTAEAFQTHVREEYSTYSWLLEAMLARAGFAIDWSDTGDEAYVTYLCVRQG